MSVRPFEKIKAPLKAAGLASTKYVERRLKEVLGKLHFTGKDVKISEQSDGQIHFEFSGGGSSSHPLKVTASGGIVTVEPGMVHSNDYAIPGNPLMFFVPTIGGIPISTVPAPTLSVSTSGTRYVCLAAVFDRLTGSCKSYPWAITIQSTPRTTPLIRAVGVITGQDSLMDIVLAKIVDGAVVADGVSGSLFVGTSVNTIHFGSV